MSLLNRRIARAEARAEERRTQAVVWSNQNVARHWMPDPRRMHDPDYRAHWREIERIQPEDKYGDWTYVNTDGWAT